MVTVTPAKGAPVNTNTNSGTFGRIRAKTSPLLAPNLIKLAAKFLEIKVFWYYWHDSRVLLSEFLALSVGVRSAIFGVDESCVIWRLWTFKHIFPDCLREIPWTNFDVGDRGLHDARVG